MSDSSVTDASHSPESDGKIRSRLEAEGLSIKPKSFGRQTWERFRRHRLAMFSFVILVLLVVGIKFGGSVNQLAILVTLISWITIARIVRGLFFQLKEADFVHAVRAAGAGPARIIFRHMLPNAMGPVLVQITLVSGAAIILESTLSFLGLGVTPPDTSLGTLIADSKGFIDVTPSRVLIPGAILTTLVLCLNFLGDGLRDALDTTTRKVRE